MQQATLDELWDRIGCYEFDSGSNYDDKSATDPTTRCPSAMESLSAPGDTSTKAVTSVEVESSVSEMPSISSPTIRLKMEMSEGHLPSTIMATPPLMNAPAISNCSGHITSTFTSLPPTTIRIKTELPENHIPSSEMETPSASGISNFTGYGTSNYSHLLPTSSTIKTEMPEERVPLSLMTITPLMNGSAISNFTGNNTSISRPLDSYPSHQDLQQSLTRVIKSEMSFDHRVMRSKASTCQSRLSANTYHTDLDLDGSSATSHMPLINFHSVIKSDMPSNRLLISTETLSNSDATPTSTTVPTFYMSGMSNPTDQPPNSPGIQSEMSLDHHLVPSRIMLRGNHSESRATNDSPEDAHMRMALGASGVNPCESKAIVKSEEQTSLLSIDTINEEDKTSLFHVIHIDGNQKKDDRVKRAAAELARSAWLEDGSDSEEENTAGDNDEEYNPLGNESDETDREESNEESSVHQSLKDSHKRVVSENKDHDHEQRPVSKSAMYCDSEESELAHHTHHCQQYQIPMKQVKENTEQPSIESYFYKKVQGYHLKGKFLGYSPEEISENVVCQSVTGSRAIKLVCQVCGKDWTELVTMIKHSISHLKGTRHWCEKCGRTFRREKNYKIHCEFHRLRMWREIEGPGSRRYTCKMCHKFFAHQDSLITHSKEHARDERSWECGICGKKFRTSEKRHTHELTHKDSRERGTIHELKSSRYSNSDEDRHKIDNSNGDCSHNPTVISRDGQEDVYYLKSYFYNKVRDYQSRGKFLGHSPEEVSQNVKCRYIVDSRGTERRTIRFVCQVCGKDWTELVTMIKHSISHLKGTRNWCEKCGRTFCREELYKVHSDFHRLGMWREIEGPGSRRYTCTMCHKFFAHPDCLITHNKEHANEPRPYECGVCDKKFEKAASRIKHEMSHTAKDRRLKCTLCPASFTNRSVMGDHMLMHKLYNKDINGYCCDQCQATFPSFLKVKVHLKSHSAKAVCERCGDVFKSVQHMARHCCMTANEALQRRNEKNHQCDVCGKKFHLRMLLRRHMLVHTRERKYSCKHCDMAFQQSSSRDRHQALHFKGGKYREVKKHTIKVKEGRDGRLYN